MQVKDLRECMLPIYKKTPALIKGAGACNKNFYNKDYHLSINF
jgi:hypothetical protein